MKFLKQYSSIIISFLSTFLFFITFFLLNDCKISTSIDDYGIGLFLIKGYENSCILISSFLTSFILFLQYLIPPINWFILLQTILGFISVISIIYCILSYKKLNAYIKYFLCIVILIFLVPYISVHIQWTQTAAITSSAGYLLLFFVFYNNDKLSKTKKILLILAILLLFYSSSLRFKAFLSVSCVYAVLIFINFLISFFRHYDMNIGLLKSVIISFKSILKLLVCFLLTFLLLVVSNSISKNIKISDKQYASYSSYHSDRSTIIDRGICDYDENKEFYNDIGLNSSNDIKVYSNWTSDSDVFTPDVLSKLSEYSRSHNVYTSFNLSYITNVITNKISKFISVNPYIIICLITIVLFILGVIVFKFRNRIRPLFPLFLITLWLGYYFIFKINDYNILSILIFCIVVTLSIVGNRYCFIFNFMFSIVFFALYTYLNFTRIVFRGTFTFIVPIVIFMLCMIDNQYFRKHIIINKHKNIFIYISTILLCIVSIFSTYYSWSAGVTDRDTSEIYDYICDNDDKVFIIGCGHSITVAFNDGKCPYYAYDVPENALLNSSWTEGSPYDQYCKEKYGIKHLYREAINSKKIFYMTSKEKVQMLTEYFEDHYGSNDKHIFFKPIKVFNKDTIVYRIISK